MKTLKNKRKLEPVLKLEKRQPNIVKNRPKKIEAEDSRKNLYEIVRTEPKYELKWEAPEFEFEPKDISWYLISLLIAFALLALALWQGNFLFAIFVVVGWIIFVYLGSREPQTWFFKLDDKGISFHPHGESDEAEKFYAWKLIDGFDVHDSGSAYKELVIKLKSRFSPFLKINFPWEKEKDISEFCAKFLTREEYEDSASDHLSKIIRF